LEPADEFLEHHKTLSVMYYLFQKAFMFKAEYAQLLREISSLPLWKRIFSRLVSGILTRKYLRFVCF